MSIRDDRATRGGMLRSNRATVDTGSGTKSMRGQRGEHLSRGNFIDFHEDLGISATPGTAAQIRKDEAEFQGNVSEQQGLIDKEYGALKQRQGEYDSVKAKFDSAEAPDSGIPGFDEAYSKAWTTFKKDNLIKVNIIDADFKTEGSYYVPQKALEPYAESGVHYLNHSPETNEWYLATKIKGMGYRGAEMHKGLGTTAMEVEAEFRNQATPLISKELGDATAAFNTAYNTSRQEGSSQLSQALGMLQSQQSVLDAAQGKLNATKKLRKDQWADIHGKYENRKNVMKEIFGGFKVEKGNAEEGSD